MAFLKTKRIKNYQLTKKQNILKEIEDNKKVDYESNDSDRNNNESLSSNEDLRAPIKDIQNLN